MARLIDANELMSEVHRYDEQQKTDVWLTSDIAALLAEQPTVDAVEVVRCKDCKHWKPGDSFGGDSLDDMQRIGRCPIVRFGRREKDFCCEGERKDND